MNKSYSLNDDVSVDFADNLFIHLINRRGPITGVRMTYQMFLKYKSAGHKVTLSGDLEIEPSDEVILDIQGEIPPAADVEPSVILNVEEEIPPAAAEETEALEDEALVDEPVEDATIEFKKYSKTQFRKWDRTTLENYLTSLPVGLIPDTCLPLNTKDKATLLEIIFQYVLVD